MIQNILKQSGLKCTKQRLQVLTLINDLGENANYKNIINTCNNVDNSTVYRIIELLLQNNIIEKRISYNEEIYYVLKEEHGHYFTCIKCGKKEKIIDCPLEYIENNYEKKGYKIINHTVLLDGICKKCLENIK